MMLHASDDPRRGIARLVAFEPAQVTHHPLTFVVQIRNAVLARDVEPPADLRVIVDETVHTNELGVRRVVVVGIDVREEHAIRGVDGALRGFP